MNILSLLKNSEKKYLIYRKLNKNETLFHEGDRCEDIGIVVSGSLRIVSYLESGNEVIYNILQEGMIFGNNLVFSSEPYYKGDIVAQSETQIALINKDDLLKFLGTNRDFLLEYLKIQSDFGKSLNNRIKLLSMNSARERFLFYLHDHHNVITYQSITQLAGQLYLSREVLSRLIGSLCREKVIIKTNKTIRLL